MATPGPDTVATVPVPPTPRIYKKMTTVMGSGSFLTGCFLCFGLVSFYKILKRHQYKRNGRHLIISYIPFCMIVHQKSQQPNKAQKTTIERCSRRYYALTVYSSRVITTIFLTKPLPRAASWTMATSNQRLDQI